MSIIIDDEDHELTVEQYLKLILLELKKINLQLIQVTGEQFSEIDIEDQT